jgi:hypothetical protein
VGSLGHLVFVDCEARGRSPVNGVLTEFGAVHYETGEAFHGLTGRFSNTQAWKRLRVTPHDHNPVNDAMGNVEAFRRIMEGDR